METRCYSVYTLDDTKTDNETYEMSKANSISDIVSR